MNQKITAALKELFEKTVEYFIQLGSIIIDSCFLVLWLIIDLFVDRFVNYINYPDYWNFRIDFFKSGISYSVLIAIIIFFLRDFIVLLIKAFRKIKSEL